MTGILFINKKDLENDMFSDNLFSDMDDFFKEELEDDELFLPYMTIEESHYTFTVLDYAYHVSINLKNKELEDILKDKKDYLKGISDYKESILIEEFSDKEKAKINDLENNFENLLDDIEYVELNLDDQNYREFIDKHSYLKDKKIVLGIKRIELTDKELLEKYLKEFEDIKDNIYVYFHDDIDYVSIEDAYKTINTVYDKVIKIKDLNLSPMETIMYVYDIVRSRAYKMEEAGEDIIESRNLSKVLFGDKIVCSGFAKTFKAYLEMLGIEGNLNKLESVDGISNGHERNVMYVKDEKYNIDGVYFFDSTWDSKNDYNNYLNKYICFAKTINEINKFSNFLVDEKIKYFNEDTVDRFYRELKDSTPDYYSVLFRYINSANKMAEYANEEKLLNTEEVFSSKRKSEEEIEETKKKYSEIYDKFVRKIPAETMIRLLLNVRKIEYYQNPELFDFDYNTFLTIFNNSNWEFEDNHTFESRLLEILGLDFQKDLNIEFNNYIKNEGIDKEINQVKLAKSLRLVLDKKQNK